MTGPTVGVEEEFLLLDPFTGHNLPVAEQATAALPDDVRAHSRREFRRSMVEIVTPVCTDLGQLREHLLGLRQEAAKAAATAGAQLVAIGATPVAEPDLAVADDPRFRQIADHYGPIVADPAVCGCHVHVGVPDRDTAIEVGNHLRIWLPVLQAMGVNSPLHAGADTGHASWRAMQLDRWPSLGPTPYFADAADFDRTVATLVGAGAMLDETMVLWHARPSARYPTVEVRVADACPTVADTVLLAGLVRGLVGTALDEIAAGRPAPAVPDHLVRAAHWNAAHTGLDGTLTDLSSGRARPAQELVDDLLTTATPALRRHGDLEPVRAGLARLRERGTGAARQRRVHARTGDVTAVLADLAHQTLDG
ncbi:glutamate--cysteine ligase [Asanoa sp. WMMD1127]|uniref:carboxylate-amine ligase n=1 Tax=Asanoa sp. WMMD1127 TaxID=3016107 RepID=UPI002417A73F|nr:glutamate--cysteine ligase [Asanoa sp. WMMD1127]MDG4826169.1 glutamate--cysteine ligase [Asanoa sp. WMMD1127]